MGGAADDLGVALVQPGAFAGFAGLGLSRGNLGSRPRTFLARSAMARKSRFAQ